MQLIADEKFEILTAPSVKMAAFWVVTSCNLVDIDNPDDGRSKLL
jgi:hypothetical protein